MNHKRIARALDGRKINFFQKKLSQNVDIWEFLLLDHHSLICIPPYPPSSLVGRKFILDELYILFMIDKVDTMSTSCHWIVFNNFYVPYVHCLRSERQENHIFLVKYFPKCGWCEDFHFSNFGYLKILSHNFTGKSWFSCRLESEQCIPDP